MALVDFQVKGCSLRFNHVCQGGYVLLNCIDFDKAEWNICCDCVEKLRGRGKSEKLNKVLEITVYGTVNHRRK